MTEESDSVYKEKVKQHLHKEEAVQRLQELVLDHLGIPRPKQSTHIQALQDDLLPRFMDLARHASLAASPLPLKTGIFSNEPSHPVYRHLERVTETSTEEMRKLNEILEELGVHSLFEAVANSSEMAMVSELPVDDYDTRLLREAGYHKPNEAIRDFLRYAAKRPQIMTDSEATLGKAEEAMLQAHRDINIFINLQTQPNIAPAPRPDPANSANVAAQKPKRLKLFSGLGKLGYGLVLLTGNAIVSPSVAFGSLMALPVLGSLAAGIGGVGEGISHLLREGE